MKLTRVAPACSLMICALLAAGCSGRPGSGAPATSPKPPEPGAPAAQAGRPAAGATAAPSAAARASEPRPGVDWPSFRGIHASGVSEGRPLPQDWSLEPPRNVIWKTAIPGLAHSSPVVWGDRVFVTTAIGPQDASLKVGLYGDIAPVPDEGEHRFVVMALDKKTGRVLWERTAFTGVPRVKRHTKSSHANPTPATDGEHLAVLFGSEGLYLYDLDGNLKWKKDLGVLDAGFYMVPAAQWGFSSSPVLHDGKVILQVDVQGGGYVAAFRVEDGEPVWKTARADVPTFSTPAVIGEGGAARVVVNGWKHVGGYDAATGAEVWKMKGGGDIPVPTPIAGNGLVYITNAHGSAAPVFAIRDNAQGEIPAGDDGAPTGPHVAWSVMRGGAYMQTPVLYGDHLYVCRDNGELSVYDARTGASLSKQRLGEVGVGGFTASGVAGDGKLFYASENGDVFVVSAGAEPKVLATNPMEETVMASPAVSDGTLFIRTRGHLVAIAAAPPS
jgi:outer membrane protein assembly factor BamB